ITSDIAISLVLLTDKMIVEIDTPHSEDKVSVNQLQSQLVSYLHDLDKRLQEERKKEVHERFRNIRCFQHILGSSTQFKLVYNKPMFSRAKVVIESLKFGSAPIRLWKDSVPNTMAMSLHSETEPAFLTYVSNSHEITVFCPELQEPIGRITKWGDESGTDICCLATNKTFRLINIDTETPASMRAMRANDGVRRKNMMKKCIAFGFLVIILLIMFLTHTFYFQQN
ncbi:hypothetical protein Bhyg_08038, partial [Pseudolycoriella hygida]